MREGRARELTIGNYPDITLSAARKLASEHRVSVDKGQEQGQPWNVVSFNRAIVA